MYGVVVDGLILPSDRRAKQSYSLALLVTFSSSWASWLAR